MLNYQRVCHVTMSLSVSCPLPMRRAPRRHSCFGSDDLLPFTNKTRDATNNWGFTMIGETSWSSRTLWTIPVITCNYFFPSYQIWLIWVYPPKKIDLTPVHETSRESEAFQPIFPIQKMRFSPRSQGFKIPGTSALSCTANSFSRPTRSKPPTAKRTPRKNRASGTYPLLYDLVYIVYI